MKKIMLALLVLTACSRAATTTTTSTGPMDAGPAAPPAARPSGSLTGGATARGAVEAFLTAVRAQDIQAMGAIFGTSRGPARDNMSQQELERRLIILQCYFNHDRFRILGESPGEGGRRIVSTELIRGGVTRTPRFYTIPGAGGRHYVENMEIVAVRDFCRNDGR